MKKFVVGIGVVAVIGVAIGILFSTKLGKKVREDMKNKTIKTVENINDAIQNKADTMKDSVAHTTHEVCHVIKDINGKTKNLKKDIKNGCHDITWDIHKTAEKISDELKKK